MAQSCAHCGATLAQGSNFCHVCGKGRTDASGDSSTHVKPIILEPNEERIFYRNGEVMVTNLRFSVPGQDFRIAEIESARVERSEGRMPWSTLLYMLGIAAMLARAYRFGFLLFIGGVVLGMLFQPKYAVVIRGASGETRALTSRDRDYLAEVVGAVKNAMAYR